MRPRKSPSRWLYPEFERSYSGSRSDLILTRESRPDPALDAGPHVGEGVPFFSPWLERVARVPDDDELVPLRQSGQLFLEAREIAERIVIALDE